MFRLLSIMIVSVMLVSTPAYSGHEFESCPDPDDLIGAFDWGVGEFSTCLYNNPQGCFTCWWNCRVGCHDLWTICPGFTEEMYLRCLEGCDWARVLLCFPPPEPDPDPMPNPLEGLHIIVINFGIDIDLIHTTFEALSS